MKHFVTNIEKETLENDNFRKVIDTTINTQVVLMSLLPLEEIGMEVHAISDQFFRVESGEGKVILDGEEFAISDGFAFVIPAGTQHNVINTSADKPMKVYTLYTPPHHKDGVIHKTKADGEADAADHM